MAARAMEGQSTDGAAMPPPSSSSSSPPPPLLTHYLTNPNGRLNVDGIEDTFKVVGAQVTRVYDNADSLKRRRQNYAGTQQLSVCLGCTGSQKVTCHLWSTLPWYMYDLTIGVRPLKFLGVGRDGRAIKNQLIAAEVNGVHRVPLTRALLMTMWRAEFPSTDAQPLADALTRAGVISMAQVIPLPVWSKLVGMDTEGKGATPDVTPAQLRDRPLYRQVQQVVAGNLPLSADEREEARNPSTSALRTEWQIMTSESVEIVKYFYYEVVEQLLPYWEPKHLLLLPGQALSWRLETIKTQPWKLCFFPVHRQTIERPGGSQEWFPELSYEDLKSVSDLFQIPHDPVAELAAFIYQRKLRPDVHGDWATHNDGGHMYSLMREVWEGRTAAVELNAPPQIFDRAIQFLVDHHIVVLDGDQKQYVYLTPVWEVQNTIVRELYKVVEHAHAGVDVVPMGAMPPRDDGAELTPLTVFPLPAGTNPCSEQQLALALFKMPISVISGKAGSGKSVAAHIWLQSVDPQQVLVVSPTNKVASDWRVQVISGRVYTLHKAIIVLKRPKLAVAAQLDQTRILIIEEASMLEATLLADLLYWLNLRTDGKLCRVVFIGDTHQLGAIGYGSVLRDVWRAFPWSSFAFTHNHRVDPRSVVLCVNANRILKGQKILLAPNCQFLCASGDLERDTARVLTTAAQAGFGEDDIQLLVFNREEKGTTPVNLAARQFWHSDKVRKEHTSKLGVYYPGARLVCKVNHYDIQLYNGTMWVLRGLCRMSVGQIQRIMVREEAERDDIAPRQRAGGGGVDEDRPRNTRVKRVAAAPAKKGKGPAWRYKDTGGAVMPVEWLEHSGVFVPVSDAERERGRAIAVGLEDDTAADGTTTGGGSKRRGKQNLGDRHVVMIIDPYPAVATRRTTTAAAARASPVAAPPVCTPETLLSSLATGTGPTGRRLIDTVDVAFGDFREAWGCTTHTTQGAQMPLAGYILPVQRGPNISPYVDVSHVYTTFTRATKHVIIVDESMETFQRRVRLHRPPRRSRLHVALAWAWVARHGTEEEQDSVEQVPATPFGDVRDPYWWPDEALVLKDSDDRMQKESIDAAFAALGIANVDA